MILWISPYVLSLENLENFVFVEVVGFSEILSFLGIKSLRNLEIS